MTVKPSFVGDPRYASAIKISREEYLRVKNNKWIYTNTLDFFLQGGLRHSNGSPYKTELFLGSLSSLSTFDSANANDGKSNTSKARMSRMQANMKNFRKGNQSIVIPQHSQSHFIVLVVHTKDHGLIRSIECYDSLRKSTRGRRNTEQNLKPQVKGFVLSIQNFWRKYVHPNISAENKKDETEEEEVLPIITYKPCPQQKNLYDCGLFAAAICLHLLDGVMIKENTFSQDNISALRFNVGKTMETWLEKNSISDFKEKNPFLGLDCSQVRSHFDTLRDISIALPEQIHHNKKEAPSNIPNATIVSDNSKVDAEAIMDSDLKKPVPKIDYRRTTTKTTSTSESKVGDDGKKQSVITTQHSEVTSERLTVTGGELIQDKHIIKMIQQHEKDGKHFFDLNDVTCFVEEYEEISGFGLKVHKSSVPKERRVYKCRVHDDCPFLLCFGRLRLGSEIVVKRVVDKHRDSPVQRQGTRRAKKRILAKDMNNAISNVFYTKKAPPVPQDIVKSSSYHNKKRITYHNAYYNLKKFTSRTLQELEQTFQLILPYLQNFEQNNKGSVVDYEVTNNTNQLRRVFLCPGFMDENIRYIRPVISCDASHMKSEHKGMLYTFAALSALDELYLIAFGIANGNEDTDNWSWMINNFVKACPSVKNEFIHQKLDSTYNEVVFISDQDKGLGKSMEEILPNNLSLNCVYHIQKNVEQKYGKRCAAHVTSVGKSYSTREEELHLNAIKNLNKSAFEYLQKIDKKTWRSTEWVQSDNRLPPRYGIRTSNSSESVNSMLDEARNLPWMDCIEWIVSRMCENISEKRMKHKAEDPSKLAPKIHQILEKRWNDVTATSTRISEREEGSFEYTVREERISTIGNTIASSRVAIHLVKPNGKWCSCGKWQDYKFPCRHALFYFKVIKENILQTVEDEYTHDFYKYKSIHNLYGNARLD